MEIVQDSSADAELREKAVRVLATLDDPRAKATLLTTVQNDREEPSLRKAAAEALHGRIDANDVPPLLHCLANLNRKAAAPKAAGILRLLVNCLGPLRDPRTFQHLAVLCGHADKDVRDAAAEALGKLGDRRATKFLLTMQVNSRDSDKVSAALNELAWQEDVATLIALAADGTLPTAVQNRVLSALKGKKDPRAAKVLDSIIRNPNVDMQVRAEAAEALALMGDPRVLDLLFWMAGEAAGAIKHDSKTGWSTGTWPVRTCFSAIAWVKDSRSLNYLTSQLSHAIDEVRVGAVQALGALRDARAIPFLVPLLHDPHAGLSRSAHALLLQLGWKPATPEEQVVSDGIQHWNDEQWSLIRKTARENAGTSSGQGKSPRFASNTPILLIRNMQVIDLPSYELSAHTCSICQQEAHVVIAPPSADIAITAGAAIPALLAGHCSHCQKIIHCQCARALRMPGATVFRCTHEDGKDGGVLRSQ